MTYNLSFFEMLVKSLRYSKSCYLCDLELVALFDIVEQGVFFGDDFLVNRMADFYFSVAGCLISPFPSNNCVDIYFAHCRSLCQ